MTAGELIDALQAAGGTLVVENGKPMLRGAQIPDALKAELRAQKAEVLAEWERRQAKSRDRYAEVPVGDVPLAAQGLVKPAEALITAVAGYVWRQPRPVHAWWMARSVEYHAQGLPPEECDWRAAVDVLCWQRSTTNPRAALDWLEGIEESAAALQAAAKQETKQQPGLL